MPGPLLSGEKEVRVNLVSSVPLQVDSVLSADGRRPARQIRILSRIGGSGVHLNHAYFAFGIGVSQPAISDGFIPFTSPSNA